MVDLGYVQQQVTSYDPEIDAFTFKNIRYAEPPIAELRFRPPLQPTPEMGGIQNGSKYASPACLQAISQFGGLSNTSVISEDCSVCISAPEPDVVPNAGLYDIRAALDWVQGYIHLFRGDSDAVTTMRRVLEQDRYCISSQHTAGRKNRLHFNRYDNLRLVLYLT